MLSLLTGPLLGIGILIVACSVSFYEGYKFASNAEQIAALEAANARLQKNNDQLQAAIEAAQKIDTAAQLDQQKATEIISDLKNQLKDTPNSCFLPGEWMRKLNELR